MKKSLRMLFILVILLMMTACAEHPVDTHVSSTPSGASSSVPTPTVSVPKPTESVPADPCSKGHTFSNNATICSVCGANYFSVTLEFRLNETKDGYVVTSVGICKYSEITIPAIYKGLPVTEIGGDAFAGCTWITKVTLPDSIIKIVGGAFEVCEALTEIRLSENLTYIGHYAFNWCPSLTEVDIPAKVTYLGVEAFANCTNLQRVSLHDGITEMEQGVFQGCESLISVYVPQNITAIPMYFVDSCKLLETVEFGGAITSIGLGAFANCESLNAIDLGDKLERIGACAFSGSTLEELVLPDSVKWIDEQAFADCESLRKISIPNGLEKLGNEITKGCDQLEYTIYEGMQYLGNEKNPYMILVGRSDPNQKHLIVHEDTRFIPENEAFSGSDIQSIYIGKSVECIYGWSEKGYRLGLPFSNMDALEKIEVSSDNKTYSASGNCLIETATKTLVQGCKNSVIPDDGSVTRIRESAFAYLDSLTSLIIPDTILEIGGNAFKYCTNLDVLVIGSGVQTIEHDIFIDVKDSCVVFYKGSEAEWEKVRICGRNYDGGFGGNKSLLEKTVYFYSEEKPTEPGNYWHYVDGKPTPWESEE